MALFANVFTTKYLPKEVTLLVFRRSFSNSDFFCVRRSPTIFEQTRQQHSNSSQRNDQIQQILDQFDKMQLPSQNEPLATSQQQIVQLSERLVQLALTATNLVCNLLQKNGAEATDQFKGQIKMAKMPTVATIEPQNTKRDGRAAENEKGWTWICEKCRKRNSILRYECQSCEKGHPTEAQREAIGRALTGVWQCFNCKKINDRLNKVCSECATKRPLKMAASREISTANGNIEQNQMENLPNLLNVKRNDKRGGETVATEQNNGSHFAQQQTNTTDEKAQKEERQRRIESKSKLGQMFFEGPAEEKQKQAMAK
ncbi:hypothetical protein niasHS_015004 [Heterodera schachtii]|uniref:RanBP2-type domain-containing protein n=1 Tax=Heterodera schachtii TaxID=97005 RepID=A0ABD2I0W6_HETSC